MTECLFVYGTLAPGEPNEHVLAEVAGDWQPATARGWLLKRGWGAALGYPGLILDADGQEVAGQVFRSSQLSAHWQRLDEFEGDGYRRRLITVDLPGGEQCQAFVYELREKPPAYGG